MSKMAAANRTKAKACALFFQALLSMWIITSGVAAFDEPKPQEHELALALPNDGVSNLVITEESESEMTGDEFDVSEPQRPVAIKLYRPLPEYVINGTAFPVQPILYLVDRYGDVVREVEYGDIDVKARVAVVASESDAGIELVGRAAVYFKDGYAVFKGLALVGTGNAVLVLHVSTPWQNFEITARIKIKAAPLKITITKSPRTKFIVISVSVAAAILLAGTLVLGSWLWRRKNMRRMKIASNNDEHGNDGGEGGGNPPSSLEKGTQSFGGSKVGIAWESVDLGTQCAMGVPTASLGSLRGGTCLLDAAESGESLLIMMTGGEAEEKVQKSYSTVHAGAGGTVEGPTEGSSEVDPNPLETPPSPLPSHVAPPPAVSTGSVENPPLGSLPGSTSCVFVAAADASGVAEGPTEGSNEVDQNPLATALSSSDIAPAVSTASVENPRPGSVPGRTRRVVVPAADSGEAMVAAREAEMEKLNSMIEFEKARQDAVLESKKAQIRARHNGDAAALSEGRTSVSDASMPGMIRHAQNSPSNLEASIKLEKAQQQEHLQEKLRERARKGSRI